MAITLSSAAPVSVLQGATRTSRCRPRRCSEFPSGITFFGTAFSEPKLIALASGFEAVTEARVRNLPQIKPTIPEDHIAGEPLKVPHRNRPKDWSPRHL